MKFITIVCATLVAQAALAHPAFAGNARANGKGSYEALPQGQHAGGAKKTSGQTQGQAQGQKKKKPAQ